MKPAKPWATMRSPTVPRHRVCRYRTLGRATVLLLLALAALAGTAQVTSKHPPASVVALAAAQAPSPAREPAPSPSPSGPGSTESPAPATTPSPSPATPGSEDGSEADSCGMFDVGCQAREAVTDWFRDLARPATELAFQLLGSTVLSTPDIDSPAMARVRDVWGVSQTIANTCFVLLITLAGVTLMAGTVLPGELGIKELLPRVVFAFLAANLSLTLIGYGIGFANGLARAFLDLGASRIDPEQAADVLGRGAEATINTGTMFLLLVDLVVVVLALWVAFVYVVRLAATMVLIAAAPVALMFHALPFTEGMPLLWWRGITGLLAIQVCQSLVFVTAMELLFSQDAPDAGTGGHFFGYPTTQHDALDLLMMACLLWILARIPSWVSRAIWRQGRPRITQSLVRTVVAYKAMTRVFSGSHHRHNGGRFHGPSYGKSGGQGSGHANSSRGTGGGQGGQAGQAGQAGRGGRRAAGGGGSGSGQGHGSHGGGSRPNPHGSGDAHASGGGRSSGDRAQQHRQRQDRHRDQYRQRRHGPDPQHRAQHQRQQPRPQPQPQQNRRRRNT